MKFTCPKCGLEHEERPAIAYNSPDNYYFLDETQKKNIATLSDDLCIIEYKDQTDRFIRTVIHQKVIGDCQPLDYGVWVSVSEKNFNDYLNNFNNEKHDGKYFGFICNNLPGYDNTMSIGTDVILRGNNRPEVIPHKEFMDHIFVQDYYQGIDKETAKNKLELTRK